MIRATLPRIKISILRFRLWHAWTSHDAAAPRLIPGGNLEGILQEHNLSFGTFNLIASFVRLWAGTRASNTWKYIPLWCSRMINSKEAGGMIEMPGTGPPSEWGFYWFRNARYGSGCRWAIITSLRCFIYWKFHGIRYVWCRTGGPRLFIVFDFVLGSLRVRVLYEVGTLKDETSGSLRQLQYV